MAPVRCCCTVRSARRWWPRWPSATRPCAPSTAGPTCASYTELQAGKETHVAALFAALESPEHAPAADWVRTLELAVGPWRFAVHGLQMIAAHVGALAPAGRIAIAASFQAADELRR